MTAYLVLVSHSECVVLAQKRVDDAIHTTHTNGINHFLLAREFISGARLLLLHLLADLLAASYHYAAHTNDSCALCPVAAARKALKITKQIVCFCVGATDFKWILCAKQALLVFVDSFPTVLAPKARAKQKKSFVRWL